MCNGAPWAIRADCYQGVLRDQPLTLYITPRKTNIVVDTSAMAGLMEHPDIQAAQILSAEWIAVDDVPVPVK